MTVLNVKSFWNVFSTDFHLLPRGLTWAINGSRLEELFCTKLLRGVKELCAHDSLAKKYFVQLSNKICLCLSNWRGSCSQPDRMPATFFYTEELGVIEEGWRRKEEVDIIRKEYREKEVNEGSEGRWDRGKKLVGEIDCNAKGRKQRRGEADGDSLSWKSFSAKLNAN